MKFSNDIIPLEQRTVLGDEQDNSKVAAKCLMYDALSKIEGKCMYTGNIVSRLGGCEHPDTCEIYNRNNKKTEAK